MRWFTTKAARTAVDSPAPPRVFPSYPAFFLRGEEGKRALLDAGCVLVDSASDADWVVLGSTRNLGRFTGKVPNILIYTHEPRFAIDAPHRQVVDGSTIHTYALSLGHFEDLWNHYLTADPQPYTDPSDPQRSGTVLIATHQPDLAYDNPADLIGLRREIAEYGVRHGLLDLYGRGWEPLPTRGESRDGTESKTWTALKHEAISAYKANIALENTYLPNYVSEKFWQAAQAGCLPIYLGSPWMDRLVDPRLYVDLRGHATPKSLFRELGQISDADRVHRVVALQERLTELRATADATVWDAWRHRAARTLVDLHAQHTFMGGPWSRASVR